MKRLLICTVLVFSLSCALLLSACGETTPATATSVGMTELQSAMTAAAPALPEMLSATGDEADAAQRFTYLSDFSYEKVENFLLSYSATGLADELAVIQVKDAATVEEAAASLRAHAENRVKLFRQYTPEQAVRAEKAQVFTQGNYAVLLICDNPDDVKAAFLDCVR